ncbi:MAG: exodeoxyribonuclease III [candidate division Zixibacteria bacterium]|nr:exodeoxyribonuclease III [candidate division Zixibacteria bacterium]
MKKIRMLSWNINGIRAIHKKGALEWFFTEQPDILCLQETKAQEEQVPKQLKEVEGYHVYFSSAERKGYSGVALYSKIEPNNVKHGLDTPVFDIEGRTIIAEYDKFVLFNIYFPNGKQSKDRLKYKMDFYDAFFDYAENLKKKGKKIIICGDVNTAHKEIDLARPKENEKVSGFLPEERAWMDKLFDHGYFDTFRMFNQEPEQYTWWDMKSRARDRNVGWRIDYFIVSESLKKKVKDAYILPKIMGSDHCPVGLEVSV